ncbi:MAG: hypothetical protein ACFFEV_00795 [Candidatus Thorarchaeota archaeon]
MGRRHHARCDYCGATEGVEWVTARSNNRDKIYCSPACRDAAGFWFSLCFTIITSSLFIWVLSIANNPLPLEFYLVMSLFIGFPLLQTIKGFRARQSISRSFRFERYPVG